MAADLAADLAFAGPAALARLVRAREVTHVSSWSCSWSGSRPSTRG